MINREKMLLDMIRADATKYKNKLTAYEFKDILSLGNCTGDGRLSNELIDKVLDEVWEPDV